MKHGKTIELFLVNGTADSLVTAELSNWNGKALKIPRKEVADCDRVELEQPGVYFLFCKEDDGSDSVYIGESEIVKDRLCQHLRDYQADKEKYYWNTAVVFTGQDLNKAYIRYLEYRLVEISKLCKRYNVLTKNVYNTTLKESQIARLEGFIENVKTLINALGYKVLEPLIQKSLDSSGVGDDEILSIKVGAADAKGIVTSEGFVVISGSLINEKTSPHLSPNMIALRKKIMSSDKMNGLTTTEDIPFTSPSAAAGFVLGYTASGPKTWKSQDGRTHFRGN